MNRIINAVIIFMLSVIMRINDTAAMIVLFAGGLYSFVCGIIFLNHKGTGIFSVIESPKLILHAKRGVMRYCMNVFVLAEILFGKTDRICRRILSGKYIQTF